MSAWLALGGLSIALIGAVIAGVVAVLAVGPVPRLLPLAIELWRYSAWVSMGGSFTMFVWAYNAFAEIGPRSPDHRLSPAGIVIWWFVPIANLVGPAHVVVQLWESFAEQRKDGRTTDVPMVAGWLIAGDVAWIATIQASPDNLVATMIIGTAARFVSLVLAIAVVRAVEAERALAGTTTARAPS